MQEKNRQWVLTSRPKDNLLLKNLSYQESSFSPRPLKPGEILIRNLAFLCAPTMRNWMDPPTENLYPSIELGTPVLAPAVGSVIESNNKNFPIGSRVSTLSSWQDYEIINAQERPVGIVLKDLTPIEAIGKFGLNSLTGYLGLSRVGIPKEGETVVVSAAAGATGSVAAQVGKIMGCKVIGIAGGSNKCSWLTEDCDLDGAIDYKNENIAARLDTLCPSGINVYFDNVGGTLLQEAAQHMAKFGRIVLCGQISTYDSNQAATGPRDMMRLIYGSVRMQGFLTRDYTKEFPSAINQLRDWEREGRLILREDVRKGFENLPRSYLDLFNGANSGLLVVSID